MSNERVINEPTTAFWKEAMNKAWNDDGPGGFYEKLKNDPKKALESLAKEEQWKDDRDAILKAIEKVDAEHEIEDRAPKPQTGTHPGFKTTEKNSGSQAYLYPPTCC